jgi:heme-degrading monooxygenase HmoA
VSYVVYVRHFLKPDAVGRRFDDIVRLHRDLVSKQAGFVSLRRLTPAAAGHENEVVMLLEFESEQQLRAWRGSDGHAVVAEQYRSLWARDPVTEFFSTAGASE